MIIKEERSNFITLVKEYTNVCPWFYMDVPRLDANNGTQITINSKLQANEAEIKKNNTIYYDQSKGRCMQAVGSKIIRSG